MPKLTEMMDSWEREKARKASIIYTTAFRLGERIVQLEAYPDGRIGIVLREGPQEQRLELTLSELLHIQARVLLIISKLDAGEAPELEKKAED